jgi:hypothetical protein
VLCDLPVHVADPEQRLHAVRAEMERLKASHMAEAGARFIDLGALAPPFRGWLPRAAGACVPTRAGRDRRRADQSCPVSGRISDTCPAAGRIVVATSRNQFTARRQASCCAAGHVAYQTSIPSVPHRPASREATFAAIDQSSAAAGCAPETVRLLALGSRASSCFRPGRGIAMSDSTDMSTPMTRGELRQVLKQEFKRFATRQEFKQLQLGIKQMQAAMATKQELKQLATKQELKQLATKQELKQLATKQELHEAVAKLATKQELHEAVAKLATKQELHEAVAKLATKQELHTWGGALLSRIEQSERVLLAQLSSQIKALEESLTPKIAIIDEKYNDLPGRVTRLETAVFPDT